MHHVPLDFEPEAIQGVLACMTPDAARIMWASKAFQVRRCGAACPVSIWAPAQNSGSDRTCTLVLGPECCGSRCVAVSTQVLGVRAVRGVSVTARWLLITVR
jgi:hypothetical protein